MSVRRATARQRAGGATVPKPSSPAPEAGLIPAPPTSASLQRLVAGLGQWSSVGKQVIALHDRHRCVALVVPISPQDRVLFPQVDMSPAMSSEPTASRAGEKLMQPPEIPPELMAVTSLRLAQFAPPKEELQEAAAEGYAAFRAYAWWLAIHASAAKVHSAEPRELVKLTRRPTLGTEVERDRVTKLCSVLSRGSYCSRDLAILSRVGARDTDAFVTAGAILRFVELTGEAVQGRHR
ncbi:MAG: hypothetical protein AAF184_16280 [Pseudomonadota bacterium]